MFADVQTRLEAEVPDLAGRVKMADDFTRLMQSGSLPSASVAAYLVPLGLTGGKAQASTGAFIQTYSEQLGVILFLRNTDARGRTALERVDAFLPEIFAALAGWGPADAAGVFELRQARLLSSTGGALAYQIEFSLTKQLRIL